MEHGGRRDSVAKRLVDRHGSHVKATGTTLQTIIGRWVGLSRRQILVPRVDLIDDSDVSRGRSRRAVPFGHLSQLFELTPLSPAPETATP